MPFSAPLPVPTMMAVGVARPRAQGQEITSTEMPMERANSKACPSQQPDDGGDEGDGDDDGHEHRR